MHGEVQPLRPLAIELHAEGGGEHRGREVFGVFAGLLRRLAVAVVLGKVAVLVRVRRAREALGLVLMAPRIASALLGEKQRSAASRHGHQPKRRCSRGFNRTAVPAGTVRPNTCSVLWVTPGA